MSLSDFFKAGLAVLVFSNAPVLGQSSQAEKKMAQGNWGSAKQILIKTLRKDTLSVSAELLMCRWFLNPNNPAQQIDSAYQYSLRALYNFQKSSTKQKEKWKRDHTDSILIVRLREGIDSLAFENAKRSNTEDAYQNFIQKFLFCKARGEAVELRDEAAFLNALRQNSYGSFQNYLMRYPQSHRASEAQERYEKLLFESFTKDKKLKSYLSFVQTHPASPYKSLADKNIFELTTITGTPNDFIRFIKAYPKNLFVHRAQGFLFHIVRETEEKNNPVEWTDSLKQILAVNKLLWAPIYKNGKYGFIDSRGAETFAPQFDAINEEYKCGSIKDDILITSNGLFSRNRCRLTGWAPVVKDLGYGFLKVGDSSCVKILHKSGMWIGESCAQDGSVLGERFLTVKRDGLVGLYALTGRMLLSPQCSAIEMSEGVIILDRMGKKSLCLPSQLASVADGNPLVEDFIFDQVRPMGEGLLLVSNGSLEGIINSKLEFVVPLARQSLYQMPFGLVRKINDRFSFNNLVPELANTTWERYRFFRQWLLLQNSGEEKLVDTHSKKVVEAHPDSLWTDEGLVFARDGDSVHVHINSSTQITLALGAKLTFVKSVDSVRYFFVEQKNKKIIFSIVTGKKLFSADFDQLESLTSDFFIVTKKNKKGLVNKLGKPILPTEYDALVLASKTQLSLLKEKKFGLYDLVSGKLIKPFFERNISPVGSEALMACKDGHYGLIDWNAKPLTLFEFDAIVPWTENEIWAKKGFEWSLIDFKQSKSRLRHIKNFHVFVDRPKEKIAFVQQENYFGVLSSQRGMIIPPSFTYITNLGSDEEPLYFTAKEVEEASMVVVIYYDGEGKLLRKQVYEEDEYARLVCAED